MKSPRLLEERNDEKAKSKVVRYQPSDIFNEQPSIEAFMHTCGINVCFLTASEMCRKEIREIEHCALNKDLFLQKPIPTDDLIREVNKRLSST